MPTQAITYAIGDVHGRADLLAPALDHLRGLSQADGVPRRVEFLGDIVDRGPESRRCLELVHGALSEFEGSILHLGNHDDWMLGAVDKTMDEEDVGAWLTQGGIETLRSYDPDLMRALDVVREEYPHHLEMLRAASILTTVGPFALVHAGIDPSYPLAEQDRDTNIWIRMGFLDVRGPFERPVIHGHTIMGVRPVVTENRISIDTGAYRTHRLTMCEIDLDQGGIRFIQSTQGGMVPQTPVIEDWGDGTILDRLPELFAEAARDLPSAA